MKGICITILLILTIAASFSSGLMILCFNYNQIYISSTLCINKNNPAAHCNGHCYLSKLLNKEEQPSSPISTSSKEKFEQVLFCENFVNDINLLGRFKCKASLFFQLFFMQPYYKKIFHPPSSLFI